MICEVSVSDQAWVLNSWSTTKFKHLVVRREFLWANHYTKIVCFCGHSGALNLIYPRTSLYEHILWMILKKIGPMHAHFQYNARKLMSLKYVLLWRILWENKIIKKAITTACSFWRQIACSFQVYGCTNYHNFCAQSTWKTLFWISRFFHLTNIDITSCFCRQFFRPLYEDKGQK